MNGRIKLKRVIGGHYIHRDTSGCIWVIENIVYDSMLGGGRTFYREGGYPTEMYLTKREAIGALAAYLYPQLYQR